MKRALGPRSRFTLAGFTVHIGRAALVFDSCIWIIVRSVAVPYACRAYCLLYAEMNVEIYILVVDLDPVIIIVGCFSSSSSVVGRRGRK